MPVISKIISLFRASDAGLGNRAPLENGLRSKTCFLCSESEPNNIMMNNETHILVRCSALADVRTSTGIQRYIDIMRNLKHGKSDIYVARLYLGHDGASPGEMLIRGAKLRELLNSWRSKMNLEQL